MKSLLLPALMATCLAAAELPEPAALPASPTLPDPLALRDGSRVGSAEAWRSRRAPELRALFQHYMYGAMPAPRGVKGTLLREEKAALGGKATLREISLDVGLAAPVHLLVLIPNERTKPAPCFLGMNFRGNHQLLDDPAIALPQGWSREPATDATRGKEKDTWAIEHSIARGYAVATFYSADVVPDDAKLAEAALAQFRSGGGERGPADTATIAAWAWGFSRCLDYVQTIAEIDGKRVASVGHSRNGKTALLAAAMDERFAMAIPSQAGCGGSAPSRVAPELAALQPNGRPKAETTAIINKNFPHWFCGHFKAFDSAVERLPFDQHCLLALCAPRPVLLSNALEDTWANPDGQFSLIAAVAPVYALLGVPLAPPAERPALGQLHADRLGYFIRPGRHAMTTPDWAAWLDFADRWLR